MKTNSSALPRRAAFTRTELAVVLACIGVLGVLILPALAANGSRSARAGCLANLRRLQTACEMYRIENNDTLMPNAPAGQSPSGWCAGSENWNFASPNTNPVYYTSTPMGAYLGNNLSVYRCPGDVVPSSNGIRIRSYSMNSQMGALYTTLPMFNPGYRTYIKGSDLICPTPANAFVFADESPYTINDGFLQLSLATPNFPDVPAAYLDGGCGFSFADGHAEYRKWQWRNGAADLTLCPVAFNVRGSYWPLFGGVPGTHTDWLWLRDHAACPK